MGSKYSDALNACYNDENGKKHPIQMGCYGIGISRTMAAAIEQNHDEHGIIWPLSIAPYHAVVIPVSEKNKDMMDIARQIYEEMQSIGIEVVLDDRGEGQGLNSKMRIWLGILTELPWARKPLRIKLWMLNTD